MNLFKSLYNPFPRPKGNLKNVLMLLLIAFGTSLFIVVFKPFNIENQTGLWYYNLIIFCLGFVFFLSIYLIEFVIPRLMPRLFKTWNLGKAILWYTLLILLVGAIIFFLKSYLAGFRNFNWMEYFYVLGRISGIAITVVFFVLGIFSYLNRKSISLITAKETYLITAPNAKALRLNLNNLIYIASDDNYVDIHLESEGVRKKLVFRSSLKNIENQIVHPLSPIYRCHRRHLINIRCFKLKNKTSRNAMLKLINYDDEIPVSKKHLGNILKLLQVRP